MGKSKFIQDLALNSLNYYVFPPGTSCLCLDLGGLAKKSILTHNTGKFTVTLFNKLEEIPLDFLSFIKKREGIFYK